MSLKKKKKKALNITCVVRGLTNNIKELLHYILVSMTASQHAQYQDLETEAAKGNHIMVWMKLVFYTVEILKDLQ